MYIPRIVLAGTHSGVGKTTLATGIMAALHKRKRPVQGYKVGPDYIDPSHHAAATGRPSRNLDRWLLGDKLSIIFAQSAANRWAVIEGVMGMFDGMSGTKGYGSTADIAKELKAPVLLIVDAYSMARSIAALVSGFMNYDPVVNIAGVILNRVKSTTQEKMLREALEEIAVPVLGCLPYEKNLKLPERHLGLVPVGEQALQEDYLEDLVNQINQYIDLDLIETIMMNASDYLPGAGNYPERVPVGLSGRTIRVGIAWDEAFLFYYQDALDIAHNYGFSFIPFSPLHDSELPPDLDGLFIGGGFPELHLEKLSRNPEIHEAIQRFAGSGKPIYAECGGYMYLGESITDFEGKGYPTVGLIPMHAEMTPRLQGMGYRRGVFRKDNFLGPVGTEVHGHEFHYSRISFCGPTEPAYQLFRGNNYDKMDGYVRDNLVASYLHLHFAGYPELLQNWSDRQMER